MIEAPSATPRKTAVKIEPRPCPFCNGPASVVQNINRSFAVVCKNDCHVRPVTGFSTRRTTAISYWNGSKPPRSGP